MEEAPPPPPAATPIPGASSSSSPAAPPPAAASGDAVVIVGEDHHQPPIVNGTTSDQSGSASPSAARSPTSGTIARGGRPEFPLEEKAMSSTSGNSRADDSGHSAAESSPSGSFLLSSQAGSIDSDTTRQLTNAAVSMENEKNTMLSSTHHNDGNIKSPRENGCSFVNEAFDNEVLSPQKDKEVAAADVLMNGRRPAGEKGDCTQITIPPEERQGSPEGKKVEKTQTAVRANGKPNTATNGNGKVSSDQNKPLPNGNGHISNNNTSKTPSGHTTTDTKGVTASTKGPLSGGGHLINGKAKPADSEGLKEDTTVQGTKGVGNGRSEKVGGKCEKEKGERLDIDKNEKMVINGTAALLTSTPKDFIRGQKTEMKDDSEFRMMLRMDHDNFTLLLDLVTPYIQKMDTNCRMAITAAERLSVTLKYMATGETQTSVGRQYRVSRPVVGRIIRETTVAIYEVLRDEYLRFANPAYEPEGMPLDFSDTRANGTNGTKDGLNGTTNPDHSNKVFVEQQYNDKDLPHKVTFTERKCCSCKRFLIFIVVLAVLAGLAVAAYFLYKHFTQQKKTDTVWSRMRLVDEVYTVDLEDRQSPHYLSLSRDITVLVDGIFKKHSELKGAYSRCEVRDFQPGSVWAEFNVVFNKEFEAPVLQDNVKSTIQNNINSANRLGRFKVYRHNVEAEAVFTRSPSSATAPTAITPKPTIATSSTTTATLLSSSTSRQIKESSSTTTTTTTTITSEPTSTTTTVDTTTRGRTTTISTTPTPIPTTAAPTCQNIWIPQCQDRRQTLYNVTTFPNALGHQTQEEASRGLAGLLRLLETECHPYSRRLVCGALVPQCIPGEQLTALLPCKDLCISVLTKCARHLPQTFIDGLDCDALHTSNCIGAPPLAPPNLRLADGAGPHEGRLEIEYNGEWGTVCDDGFDKADADVVCRQLGYTNGGIARQEAYFTAGEGEIWLQSVECQGSERHLTECRHSPYGRSACTHREDAGVTCITNSPEVSVETRLVGGSGRHEGRVEVFYKGRWGPVCDDQFTQQAARTVCRSIGYSDLSAARVVDNTDYSASVGEVWLDNVRCNGSEPSIALCPHNPWGQNDCSTDHSEDVAVSCLPPPATTTSTTTTTTTPSTMSTTTASSTTTPVQVGNLEVRLRRGADRLHGLLQVRRRGGEWGGVCDDGFEFNEAAVVCRMLGYTGQDVTYSSSQTGVDKLWLDDVDCLGRETSLSQCDQRPWGEHNCNPSTEAVEVFCGPEPTVPPTHPPPTPSTSPLPTVMVRLENGPDALHGVVVVSRLGATGTVCDDEFDIEDAKVICRMLGYTGDDIQYGQNLYGAGTGDILLDDLRCVGDETTLALCRHSGWGVANCDHLEDVGVGCGPVPTTTSTTTPVPTSPPSTTPAPTTTPPAPDIKVRLVGGIDSGEGSLQLYLQNRGWTPVCGQNLALTDASAVCSMLGFNESSPEVMMSSRYQRQNVTSGVTCDTVSSCLAGAFVTSSCSMDMGTAISCVPQRVRLVGGAMDGAGRVEVFYQQQWGNICDDRFDDLDARVVCGMLGYNGSAKVLDNPPDSPSDVETFLDELSCTGNESSVFHCTHYGLGRSDCSYHEAVGVRCSSIPTVPTPLPIRLVEGDHYLEGRVEVLRNGSWGAVCDQNFGQPEVDVVCRMLNASGPGRLMSFLSQWSTSAWLDDVSCSGREGSLADCSHAPWGQTASCYNVGVSCGIPTTVPTTTSTTKMPTTTTLTPVLPVATRISGSTMGRVEVLYDGAWGTVCKDSFGTTEAQVVCRSIGFNNTAEAKLIDNTLPDVNNSVPIHLDNVRCIHGNETNLAFCEHNSWGDHNCIHREDVAVQCAPLDESSVKFRLSGGLVPSEGRLEVLFEGQWGAVCDDGFTDRSAQVACRQLNHSDMDAHYLTDGRFGRAPGLIWLSQVSCEGDESTLLNCSRDPWGKHNCEDDEAVSIQCTAPAKTFTLPAPTASIAVMPGEVLCEDITVSDCVSVLPYSYTALPNKLGHKTQAEVQAFLSTTNWHHLFGECTSPDLGAFVCSLLLPECLHLGEAVARKDPCMSLCQRAKDTCSPQFGPRFEWPSEWACSDLLNRDSEGFQDLCFDGQPQASTGQCEPIQVPFCSHDLHYNRTQLPNALGHHTQQKAQLATNIWMGVADTSCHPKLRPFVCAMYTPPCPLFPAAPLIRPCASTCQEIQSACQSQLPFPWPADLNCFTLPMAEFGQPCDIVQLPQTTTTSTTIMNTTEAPMVTTATEITQQTTLQTESTMIITNTTITTTYEYNATLTTNATTGTPTAPGVISVTEIASIANESIANTTESPVNSTVSIVSEDGLNATSAPPSTKPPSVNTTLDTNTAASLENTTTGTFPFTTSLPVNESVTDHNATESILSVTTEMTKILANVSTTAISINNTSPMANVTEINSASVSTNVTGEMVNVTAMPNTSAGIYVSELAENATTPTTTILSNATVDATVMVNTTDILSEFVTAKPNATVMENKTDTLNDTVTAMPNVTIMVNTTTTFDDTVTTMNGVTVAVNKTVNLNDTGTINTTETLNDTVRAMPNVTLMVNTTDTLYSTVTAMPSVTVMVNATETLNDTVTALPNVTLVVNTTGTLDGTVTSIPSVTVMVNATENLNDNVTTLPNATVMVNTTETLNATVTGMPNVTIVGNTTQELNENVTAMPNISTTVPAADKPNSTDVNSTSTSSTTMMPLNATIVANTPSSNKTTHSDTIITATTLALNASVASTTPPILGNETNMTVTAEVSPTVESVNTTVVPINEIGINTTIDITLNTPSTLKPSTRPALRNVTDLPVNLTTKVVSTETTMSPTSLDATINPVNVTITSGVNEGRIVSNDSQNNTTMSAAVTVSTEHMMKDSTTQNMSMTGTSVLVENMTTISMLTPTPMVPVENVINTTTINFTSTQKQSTVMSPYDTQNTTAVYATITTTPQNLIDNTTTTINMTDTTNTVNPGNGSSSAYLDRLLTTNATLPVWDTQVPTAMVPPTMHDEFNVSSTLSPQSMLEVTGNVTTVSPSVGIDDNTTSSVGTWDNSTTIAPSLSTSKMLTSMSTTNTSSVSPSSITSSLMYVSTTSLVPGELNQTETGSAILMNNVSISSSLSISPTTTTPTATSSAAMKNDSTVMMNETTSSGGLATTTSNFTSSLPTTSPSTFAPTQISLSMTGNNTTTLRNTKTTSVFSSSPDTTLSSSSTTLESEILSKAMSSIMPNSTTVPSSISKTEPATTSAPTVSIVNTSITTISKTTTLPTSLTLMNTTTKQARTTASIISRLTTRNETDPATSVPVVANGTATVVPNTNVITVATSTSTMPENNTTSPQSTSITSTAQKGHPSMISPTSKESLQNTTSSSSITHTTESTTTSMGVQTSSTAATILLVNKTMSTESPPSSSTLTATTVQTASPSLPPTMMPVNSTSQTIISSTTSRPTISISSSSMIPTSQLTLSESKMLPTTFNNSTSTSTSVKIPSTVKPVAVVNRTSTETTPSSTATGVFVTSQLPSASPLETNTTMVQTTTKTQTRTTRQHATMQSTIDPQTQTATSTTIPTSKSTLVSTISTEAITGWTTTPSLTKPSFTTSGSTMVVNTTTYTPPSTAPEQSTPPSTTTTQSTEIPTSTPPTFTTTKTTVVSSTPPTSSTAGSSHIPVVTEGTPAETSSTTTTPLMTSTTTLPTTTLSTTTTTGPPTSTTVATSNKTATTSSVSAATPSTSTTLLGTTRIGTTNTTILPKVSQSNTPTDLSTTTLATATTLPSTSTEQTTTTTKTPTSTRTTTEQATTPATSNTTLGQTPPKNKTTEQPQHTLSNSSSTNALSSSSETTISPHTSSTVQSTPKVITSTTSRTTTSTSPSTLASSNQPLAVDSTSTTCSSISDTVCSSRVNYTSTGFPNFFNHTSKSDAVSAFGRFQDLTVVDCSLLFERFTCSLYLPPCEASGNILQPCMSLCQSVKQDCGLLLDSLSVPIQWPVDCSQLPSDKCYDGRS